MEKVGINNGGGVGEAAERLTLDARAENAAIARRAVAREAARAGLSERLAADAQLVVTESFTNAIRHAGSRAPPGPVHVLAAGDPEGLTVVVRDSGEGFRPKVPDEAQSGGFGLSLIVALADRVELERTDDGGTELRARLRRH